MAQLAPIVTLAATGASLYAQSQQAARTKKNAQAQQQNTQLQQETQQQILAAQAQQDNAERQRTLDKSLASARARLAAGGTNPNEGSAAALASGLRSAAEEEKASSDAVYAARLAAGRKSLLDQDSSLNNWVQAGRSLGRTVTSLLG